MNSIGILAETSEWGGTEINTVAVARALASRGRSVCLIQVGHDFYDRHGVGGLHRDLGTVRVPQPPRSVAARIGFWRGLVDRHRLDTMVLPKTSFDVRWSTLDLALLRRGKRFVHIQHVFPPDLEPLKPRRRLGGLVPGLGLWYWRYRGIHALHRAAADHVVAVSHAIRDRLVGDFGYRPGDVTVVHNGVDAARFRPDGDAAALARNRWGIPASAFVVGTVTRLAPVKRLERLLAAFRLLLETASEDCYLVIVGEGREEAALRSAAEQSGIAARCVWAGASASPWAEFPGFDCFAITSEREGLPHALVEAMACECVPVAMDAPGISEVVTDGVTGRLVGQDVGAFATALREVMADDPSRRKAMGGWARRFVQDHHDERRQIEATCDVILGSANRPVP